MRGRRVGLWGSTPRPITAGSGSWTAMARRSCAPGATSAADGQSDQRAGRAASGRLRPRAIPALGRPASPLSWPAPLGRDPAVDHGVWRVLGRHGLSTRAKRDGLVAGYAAPPEPQRPDPAPERHLDVDHPGQLVQLDCSASVGCRGPRGRCGNTPPSTSPRPPPGRPSRSHPLQDEPFEHPALLLLLAFSRARRPNRLNRPGVGWRPRHAPKVTWTGSEGRTLGRRG